MTNSALNFLARLAVKNHQEMQSLMGGVRKGQKSPLEWALSLAAANAGMTFQSDTESGSVFKFTQGARSYQLQIPQNVKTLDDAVVSLKLEQTGHVPHVFRITGAQLVNLSLSPDFVELHKTALSHLKQFYSFGTQTKMTEKPGEQQPSAAESSATEATSSSQDSAEPKYSMYVVARDNLPNLKFKGKLLASVFTPVRHGRQRVYAVYETESGKKIGVNQGISYWLGEKDLNQAAVFESNEELVKFFGYDSLAKFLYQELALTEHSEELVS